MEFFRKLKNVLVGIAAVALLLTVGTTTYAWMSRNRATGADGMRLEAAEGEMIDIAAAYLVSFDSERNEHSCLDLTEVDAAIHMPRYDTVFLENNINTTVLMRVTVGGIEKAAGTIHLDLSATGPLTDGTGKVANVLSNVVRIKAGAIPVGSALTAADIDTASLSSDDLRLIYEAAKTALSPKDASIFHVVDGEKLLTCDVAYTADEVSGDGTISFDIAMTYDPDLIDAYRDSFGADVLTLALSADLGALKLSQGGGAS